MALSPTSSRSSGGGSGFPLTGNTDAGGYFLTNLGVIGRVNTVASSATPSINTDTTDLFTITALAAAITSMSANLTGAPVNGQKLQIAITDNGTPRALAWGASFESSGNVTLPAITVASTRIDTFLVYNGVTSKWRAEGVS